jgi:thiol-disulfide isomerase/thioredoxin
MMEYSSMRVFFALVIGLLLTACAPGASPPAETPAAAQSAPELPDMGLAPELENEVWLNTPQPLRLSQLQGQVVLLEMWTFGCVNCQHVIPHIRDWYQTYQDQGLVVIGNHYPEFSFEEDLSNLKQALNRWKIGYPVAQDNDGRTWRAYGNRYWPTLYLIDKRGHLRYVHIGEGRYEETEAAIQELLAEPGA